MNESTALIQFSGKWQDAAGAWLAEVAQRTGSERTPQEYARLLGRFLAGVGDPLLAMPAHVHEFAYATGPSGKTPSASTTNVRLAAVSSFYSFLERMDLVALNPAAKVRHPHPHAPTPKGLTAPEMRRLLAMIADTPVGLRDRAIVVTCVLTGLRRAEVMGLRKRDLTTNGAVYYQCRAKGGVERHRELPAPAFHAIVRALEAQGRPLPDLADDDYLFFRKEHANLPPGDNLKPGSFAANLKRYLKKAGLPASGMHVLRHTAAKLRREGGSSIEDVSALLGHASIATTARYLARLEGQDDNGWYAPAAALGL